MTCPLTTALGAATLGRRRDHVRYTETEIGYRSPGGAEFHYRRRTSRGPNRGKPFLNGGQWTVPVRVAIGTYVYQPASWDEVAVASYRAVDAQEYAPQQQMHTPTATPPRRYLPPTTARTPRVEPRQVLSWGAR